MPAEFVDQAGIITHKQAVQRGVTPDAIRHRLARGRWRRVHRGTYATFNGPMPRLASLWAAILAAGEGATLSHQTAAELIGLTNQACGPIHVTIPGNRHLKSTIAGVVVHRSGRLDIARNPVRLPPQTRVEATVLDLVEVATSIDDAVAWMASACGHRLTTADRLRDELAARKRCKWRAELLSALDDIGSGSHSLLELRYLRQVERAHLLPLSARQSRKTRPAGRAGLSGIIFEDVEYPQFGVVVELDGRAAHPVEQTFRDLDRDNTAAVGGGTVLHYGWDDVINAPCRVAAQVASVLAIRGWSGTPRCCGKPNCVIAAD